MAISLTPIGYVHNAAALDTPLEAIRAQPSEVVLDEKYRDGLMGLDRNALIVVIFYFDRAEGYALRLHPRGDPSRPLTGLFNTRTPHRPNPIGVTVVRLMSVEGNRLVVEGLDAIDGTPVLDVKPYSSEFDGGVDADGPRKD